MKTLYIRNIHMVGQAVNVHRRQRSRVLVVILCAPLVQHLTRSLELTSSTLDESIAAGGARMSDCSGNLAVLVEDNSVRAGRAYQVGVSAWI